MGALAAEDSSEQFWRSTLSQQRRELKELLENWGKMAYEDKDSVVHDYFYFLYTTIHKDRSDVNADLRILEDLQTLLEDNIVDGERNYTQYQVALIHILKKIGMMLQELRCILKEGIVSPDDEIGKWIEDQLHNEEREGYPNYVHGFERQVVKQANAIGIPINEEIITFKEIRNGKPHEIKDRLMVYYKELEKADNMPQDNVDWISRGPEMCEFTKEMISELSHRYLVKPDDDIKDRRDGVRTTIQAVDSSKCLLKCGAYSQFSPSTTSTNHR
ncbi:hypothetical protein C5167_004508 [Papaver somniferum]|uniref:Uncharacterized protein n=2 Tax=Papaver somniferum TaxID=3469 RepID=A0A4Y7JAV8_PAPSO|nr:hypothetical protein C5167_004508 [Papaver somniferum]